MWVVIFYDEDGDVMENGVGPFASYAVASMYGAEQRGGDSFYGYLVIEVNQPE